LVHGARHSLLLLLLLQRKLLARRAPARARGPAAAQERSPAVMARIPTACPPAFSPAQVLQTNKAGAEADPNITALTDAVRHAAQWTKDSQAAVAAEIGSTIKQGDPKVGAGGLWVMMGDDGR
jgi:hypothetical protein